MSEWQPIRRKPGHVYTADVPRNRGSIEARMGEDATLYEKLERRWFGTRLRARLDDGVRSEWKARYCARGIILIKRWRALAGAVEAANGRDIEFLRADEAHIVAMLGTLSPSRVLERIGFESRLAEVRRQLTLTPRQR